jgi:hypothetical protein
MVKGRTCSWRKGALRVEEEGALAATEAWFPRKRAAYEKGCKSQGRGHALQGKAGSIFKEEFAANLR